MKNYTFFAFLVILTIFRTEAQTITVNPASLNMGTVLYSESSDGSHNFTFSADDAMGAGDGGGSTIIWIDGNSEFNIGLSSTGPWVEQLDFETDNNGDLAETTVYVKFIPYSKGNRSLSLYIYEDGFTCDNSINLSGIGLAPTMEVYGNSLLIVNNDNTPSETDHTDFGSIAYGGGTVDRTFTIKNSASTGSFGGNLKLTGSPIVIIGGANAADFAVISQPATPVAPDNGTTTFTVRFSPSVAGLRNATISIASNDKNKNPYSFSICGTGASPEIDIKGNDISIADGDNTPSTADFTDFGNVDICMGTLTRTFYIHNTGSANLILTDQATPNGIYVWITGTDAANFSVTAQPTTPITPSSSVAFQITYNPGSSGTHTAEVHVLSNDTDESEYNFYIAGSGVTPEIDIQGNSASIANNDNTPSLLDHTDFDAVDYTGNNTIVRTFTIFNLNAGPLTGTLCLQGDSPYVTIGGEHAADFTVTQAPVTPVNVGQYTTFQITFDPSAPGVRNATVTILSNDLDESPYTFAIRGTGASLPVVSTTSISSITVNSATSGGNITSTGGLSITARGVCYGTSINPDLGGFFTTNGTGSGVYASSITSLTGATHYFVRAYATNSIGTSYGANKSFWTLANEPATHPSSFAVHSKTQTSLQIKWNPSIGATGYIVLQKTGITPPNNSGIADAINPSSFSLPLGTTIAADLADTIVNITGLSVGTDYSFAVVAYAKGANDSTYNYKSDGTLSTLTAKTLKNAPSTQAYSIVFSAIQPNSFTVEWLRGNGDSCLVVVHEGAPVDASPADGMVYQSGTSVFNDGSEIGSGNFVAYKGTGTSFNITGLSPATTYYFKVFEYNNGGINSLYNKSDASNNPRSQATIKPTPTIQDYDIVFSNVNVNSLTLSWSKGNGDYSFVIGSVGNNLYNPVDGTTYNANSSFGSGNETGAGCYVLYKGTASTVNITNLSANTTYYFKVIAYNNPGTSYTRYLTANASNNPLNITTLKNAPTTQASSVVFSNVKSTTATVSWTRGNGDYTMLIARQDGAVTNPSDNTSYSASAVFGSGSQIGTGTYVLYIGTDANPSVNISGLSRNNTYYFKAIEFNNHNTSYPKYNTGTATQNPNSVVALTAAPTIQSSSGNAQDIETTSATIHWTSGNGQNRLVLAKAGSAITQFPQNGTSYTAGPFGTGSNLGNDNYAVYFGNSDSFSLSGLIQNTTYYIRIFECNETGSDAEYLVSTETGNPFSFSTLAGPPSTQASNIIFSNKTATSFTIGWTNGSGDARLVILNTANTFTNPVDGTDPTANPVWQNSGEQVVYNGTGNSVAITGLSSFTTYYARIYEYNNAGTSTKYKTSAATGNPASTTTLNQIIEAASSGAWDNPAVWGGTVPGPTDNVIIQAGFTVTVPAGKASVECYDLTIEPSAALTIDGSLHVHGNLLVESSASGTGSVIDKGTFLIDGTKSVQIYIAQSDRYYYISSPLAGVQASVFGDINGTELVYKRNTTASLWERVTNPADLLETGRGYAIKLTGAPKLVTLTGTTLTTGNINPSLLYAGDKWNLVGNPYPSSIDWGTGNDPVVSFSNIRNIVYIKHGANFAYWLPELNGGNGTGLNDGTRYIPALQSFWIKSTGNLPEIYLNNNVRLHNTASLLKNNELFSQYLRIKVSRSEYSDEALLGFDINAENWIDKYDAEKMFGIDNVCPQIYMAVEGEKLAAATHALFTGNFSQPLCFKTYYQGQFTLNFSGTGSFGPLASVYLEDKLTGRIRLISDNTPYIFESQPGDFTNRFVIHISDGTTHYNPYNEGSANNILQNQINLKVCGSGKYITIEADNPLKAIVRVYNILGKELTNIEMNSNIQIIAVENTGTYLVKVSDNSGTVIHKIVIQ